MATSKVLIPISGATRPETIVDALSAANIDLTPGECEEIAAGLPASLERSYELEPSAPFRG